MRGRANFTSSHSVTVLWHIFRPGTRLLHVNLQSGIMMLSSLQWLDALHAFTSGSWRTNRFGRIMCEFSCCAGFWSSCTNVKKKKILPWLKWAGAKQCVRAHQSREHEGNSLTGWGTRGGIKDAAPVTTACGESLEEKLTELLLCCCCNSLWVFFFFFNTCGAWPYGRSLICHEQFASLFRQSMNKSWPNRIFCVRIR